MAQQSRYCSPCFPLLLAAIVLCSCAEPNEGQGDADIDTDTDTDTDSDTECPGDMGCEQGWVVQCDPSAWYPLGDSEDDCFFCGEDVWNRIEDCTAKGQWCHSDFGHAYCSDKIDDLEIECYADDDCETGEFCTSGLCLQRCEGIILFTDESLENVILKELGKQSGPIYAAEVESIEKIVAQADEGGSLGRIFQLDGIQCLKGLRELWFFDHGFVDLRPLQKLAELEELHVSETPVSSVAPLAVLTGLRVLDVGGGKVETVDALSQLTSLESLVIGSNRVVDISPLASLVGLRKLWIQHNAIRVIAAVAGMPELEDFRADRNGIEDILALRDLGALDHVELQSNSVSDIAALVDNAGFSENGYLDVQANPLDCESQRSNIESLVARGIEVISDCN